MSNKLLIAIFANLFLQPLAGAQEINLVSEVAEGGFAIIVILGLSVLFLAVSIERLLHLRASFIVPSGLLERVKPLWAAGEFVKLQTLLAKEDSTLARILSFMVLHRQQSFAIVSSGVGDIASLELRHHQYKAYALAIVATVAPIVGLLGTVIGMIEAFHVIAYAEGMGDPALLAGGISKALICTAGGLSVALPALAMHHFFKNRNMFFGLALERTVNLLINEWFMPADEKIHPTNLHVVTHAH